MQRITETDFVTELHKIRSHAGVLRADCERRRALVKAYQLANIQEALNAMIEDETKPRADHAKAPR